jgi:hypothetical protein
MGLIISLHSRTLFLKGGFEMADKEAHRKQSIRLKDKAGNEFLCPLDALKSVSKAKEEELADCVEEDVVGRYSGDIEIVK